MELDYSGLTYSAKIIKENLIVRLQKNMKIYYFFKTINSYFSNLLVSKDALNWSKVTVNVVLLNFLFIQETWKIYITVSTNILSTSSVFNIDNNKTCFLSSTHLHTRMISEGSCDTEDWRLSFAITGINYIFKYIQTENSHFLFF